jgi:hypothetical protein
LRISFSTNHFLSGTGSLHEFIASAVYYSMKTIEIKSVGFLIFNELNYVVILKLSGGGGEIGDVNGSVHGFMIPTQPTVTHKRQL